MNMIQRGLILFFILRFNDLLSQAFLIEPQGEDTIVYNSSLFRLDDEKTIYRYGRVSGNHRPGISIRCLDKLKIENIREYVGSCDYLLSEKYMCYAFDSYISYSLESSFCFELNINPFPENLNSSMLYSSFIVQFDEEPIRIVFDEISDLAVRNDTVFDFKNLVFFSQEESFEIEDYGGFTCYFADGSKRTVYNIWCRVKEGVGIGFYITTVEDQIQYIYKYHSYNWELYNKCRESKN